MFCDILSWCVIQWKSIFNIFIVKLTYYYFYNMFWSDSDPSHFSMTPMHLVGQNVKRDYGETVGHSFVVGLPWCEYLCPVTIMVSMLILDPCVSRHLLCGPVPSPLTPIVIASARQRHGSLFRWQLYMELHCLKSTSLSVSGWNWMCAVFMFYPLCGYLT